MLTRLLPYTAAQFSFQTGSVLMVSISVLAGQSLAPTPELASLPVTLATLGTLAWIFPGSLLMRRVGRRLGFLVGTGLGFGSISLALVGLLHHDFWLFTLAQFGFGIHQGNSQFIRFAAMESVEPPQRSKALSWVILAGIPAAFLGPWLGQVGKTLVETQVYAACYLFVLAAMIAQMISSAFIRPGLATTVDTGAAAEPARPLGQRFRDVQLVLAMAAAASSFAVMVMIMNATPLAMHHHGHAANYATIALQWHVVAMFLPSVFSGQLIKRFGERRLILLGILAMLIEAGLTIAGTEAWHFIGALVFLGIGWNFLYVGGTSLLVSRYRPSERASTQGVNDTLVFGLSSLAAFGAGFLEIHLGWVTMNLVGTLVFGVLIGLWLVAGRRSKAN